ncbi:MAG: hypothetical protein K6G47_05430 [Clostridia bacterium]|nr:hypothetical protein [Clostridia bacterium]
MEARIIKVIQNMMNNDSDIDTNVDLKAYGVDSLAKVQLLVDLEDEFGIEFEEDDINQNNFSSVLTIKETISKYISE